MRSCVFLFYSYGTHRHLHSFPTRRSSDLRRAAPWRGWSSRADSATDWRAIGSRSEEHTSELQSRGHLVCRLLLEKKNISRTYSSPVIITSTFQSTNTSYMTFTITITILSS